MTELPWDDPEHDVTADFRDFIQRQWESWPGPFFEPILPEWLKEKQSETD